VLSFKRAVKGGDRKQDSLASPLAPGNERKRCYIKEFIVSESGGNYLCGNRIDMACCFCQDECINMYQGPP
jgi:hypothetical protein